MNTSPQKSKKIEIKKLMGSPVTLIISMVAGGLAGKYLPVILPYTKLFSELYMKLLQMGVLPLAFAAVSVNISTLLNRENRSILKRFIIAAFAVLLISSTIGTLTSVALRGFLAPDDDTKSYIVSLQNEEAEDYLPTFEEISFYNSVDVAPDEITEYKISDFLLNIIPDNIFYSLNSGDILKVIFFSIILGIMLSITGAESAGSVIKALDVIYKTFCKYINIILTALPLGMFSILANQFSNPGSGRIFESLIRLIGMIYLVCLIIVILMFVVIQIKTGCSVKTHLLAIQRTFFLAISTSSCIATLAVATEDIIKHFRLKESLTRSILPIMITVVQSGVISSTTIMMVFASLLYGVPLSVNVIMIIIIGSIFYAFSIIGVPGLVAATMLSIVSTPLGIPNDIISIIAISTVLFFDPIAVFSSVYCDIAVATCIVPRDTTDKVDYEGAPDEA